ncbi:hypothetical protein FRC02_007146 [Tulasnella sp. 418]|nr:hypothetical protein FRC02_007146 [Tulasnella sp. 418]
MEEGQLDFLNYWIDVRTINFRNYIGYTAYCLSYVEDQKAKRMCLKSPHPFPIFFTANNPDIVRILEGVGSSDINMVDFMNCDTSRQLMGPVYMQCELDIECHLLMTIHHS